MNAENSLAQRTGYNILARVVSALVFLFIHGYASRKLGAELFGEAQYALWAAQTAWIFLNIGLPHYCYRFFPLKKILPQYFFLSKYFFLFLFLQVISSLIIAFFIVGKFSFFYSLFFIVLSLFWIIQVVLESSFQLRLHFQLLLVSSILTLVATVPVINIFGKEGYIALFMLQALIYTIITFILLQKNNSEQPQNDTIQMSKEIIQFILYSWLNAIVAMIVWQRIEIYFVQNNLGAVNTGIYSAILIFVGIIVQVFTVLFSQFRSYYASIANDVELLSKEHTFYLKVVIIVLSFVAPLLLLNGEIIFNSIFSISLLDIKNIYVIALLFSAFSSFSLMNSNVVIYALGKSNLILLSNIILGIMYILLLVFSNAFSSLFYIVAAKLLIQTLGVFIEVLIANRFLKIIRNIVIPILFFAVTFSISYVFYMFIPIYSSAIMFAFSLVVIATQFIIVKMKFIFTSNEITKISLILTSRFKVFHS